MADVIVLRGSPDWRTWTPEESRPFLRAIGYPEDLVVEFVALWDRSFALDYRAVRERLQRLSLASYAAVRGAEILPHEEAREQGLGPEDRIVFADDDDALAPELFERLEGAADGWVFGSVRIGPQFAAGAAVDAPAVQLRPLDGFCYTNSYAVTGGALARLGWAHLFDHGPADAALRGPGVRRRDVPLHLSATLKHPCSTVFARAFMPRPEFRADPRAVVEAFARALEAAEAPPEAPFVAALLPELRSVMRDVLG